MGACEDVKFRLMIRNEKLFQIWIEISFNIALSSRDGITYNDSATEYAFFIFILGLIYIS